MRYALILLALTLSLPAQAKTRVLATVPDLAAITREIGGAEVDVKSLTRPAQDPHFVDAKPSLILEMSNADLLVVNGLELEVGWLPVLLTQSRNEKVQRGGPGYFDASTVATLLEVPQQKLDRSMGDVHPGGNPHYLKDPRIGIKVAKAIADKLAQLDAKHAELFHANAAAFEKHVNERIADWNSRLAPFKGTKVVTYHKSWTYFDAWAGFTEAAYVEPKPGLAPSIGHLAEVMQVIKAQSVPLIFIEPWYPSSTSETLADRTGAKLLKLPGQTGDDQKYEDYIETLVSKVTGALKK